MSILNCKTEQLFFARRRLNPTPSDGNCYYYQIVQYNAFIK
jgi:hypothetical protein